MVDAFRLIIPIASIPHMKKALEWSSYATIRRLVDFVSIYLTHVAFPNMVETISFQC